MKFQNKGEVLLRVMIVVDNTSGPNNHLQSMCSVRVYVKWVPTTRGVPYIKVNTYERRHTEYSSTRLRV